MLSISAIGAYFGVVSEVEFHVGFEIVHFVAVLTVM